jgi:hypothetical protein
MRKKTTPETRERGQASAQTQAGGLIAKGVKNDKRSAKDTCALDNRSHRTTAALEVRSYHAISQPPRSTWPSSASSASLQLGRLSGCRGRRSACFTAHYGVTAHFGTDASTEPAAMRVDTKTR